MKSLQKIATNLGNLLEEKNKNYGSAVEEVPKLLTILFPNGVKPEQYSDLLLIVRVFDKIKRISTGAKEDSWFDVAGYGILGEWMCQKGETKNEKIPN